MIQNSKFGEQTLLGWAGLTQLTQVPIFANVVGSSDSPPAETDPSMVMRTLPTWGFAKASQGVIERLKTEITGAKFVEKLFASSNKRGTTTTTTDENGDGDSSSAGKLDISDILQPKKKAKKTGSGVKGKAKAKSRANGPEPEYDDVTGADAAVPLEHGAERPRWWVDDMLLSLVHAAGGSLSCYSLDSDRLVTQQHLTTHH